MDFNGSKPFLVQRCAETDDHAIHGPDHEQRSLSWPLHNIGLVLPACRLTRTGLSGIHRELLSTLVQPLHDVLDAAFGTGNTPMALGKSHSCSRSAYPVVPDPPKLSADLV